MFGGTPGALIGGSIVGVCGFFASLIIGPAVAVTDNTIRRRRLKFADQQMQAQNSALSLLRASSVPASQQKAELLRTAHAGPATPPQELLRAVQTDRPEGD
jgi:hypothetical protein